MTIRPYLIIPKLIQQPTWGGTYISETKGWSKKVELNGIKIGQSYELFDKINLSLLTSSEDPAFKGELTDSKSVSLDTHPENSISLHDFVEKMPLLIKFTQALGNSFQIHVKEGISHPRWKTKPESWYYFEPGLITCGVKADTNWEDYQKAVIELQNAIVTIVENLPFSYDMAKERIDSLIKHYNPWQYVHIVDVPAGTLLDLSACGIHHSWEEDFHKIPLGNVLYEVQLNVMDNVSTIRNFDKGKIGMDGSLRTLHIEDYFALIDRSLEANTPQTHMRAPAPVIQTASYIQERVMQTQYYTTDKLTINSEGSYNEKIESFRHLYIESGHVEVQTENAKIQVFRGHSVFVPANVHEYSVVAKKERAVLLLTFI